MADNNTKTAEKSLGAQFREQVIAAKYAKADAVLKAAAETLRAYIEQRVKAGDLKTPIKITLGQHVSDRFNVLTKMDSFKKIHEICEDTLVDVRVALPGCFRQQVVEIRLDEEYAATNNFMKNCHKPKAADLAYRV